MDYEMRRRPLEKERPMSAPKDTFADQVIAGAKAASARIAETAKTGAERAKDAYEKMAADAGKATDYYETVATRTIGDMATANRKLIELAKEDAEAALYTAKEIFESKNIADALSHQMTFIRGRIDARRALASDAYAAFKKASEEAWKPAQKALKAVETQAAA